MDETTSQIVSQFVQILLETVLLPALVALTIYCIRWLAAKAEEAKGNLPTNLLYTMRLVADQAVWAAQQSGLAGHIENEGKAKKEYAMRWAEEQLKASLGLSLNLNRLGDEWWKGIVGVLDGAIEASYAQEIKRDDILNMAALRVEAKNAK